MSGRGNGQVPLGAWVGDSRKWVHLGRAEQRKKGRQCPGVCVSFYHWLGRRLDQCASAVPIRCRMPGVWRKEKEGFHQRGLKKMVSHVIEPKHHGRQWGDPESKHPGIWGDSVWLLRDNKWAGPEHLCCSMMLWRLPQPHLSKLSP